MAICLFLKLSNFGIFLNTVPHGTANFKRLLPQFRTDIEQQKFEDIQILSWEGMRTKMWKIPREQLIEEWNRWKIRTHDVSQVYFWRILFTPDENYEGYFSCQIGWGQFGVIRCTLQNFQSLLMFQLSYLLPLSSRTSSSMDLLLLCVTFTSFQSASIPSFISSYAYVLCIPIRSLLIKWACQTGYWYLCGHLCPYMPTQWNPPS